ncbi:hypothetical protein AGMMS50218_02900 [Actinomycetota bacterium]|nr:hypothetical protein AGMMS50218_02900 [Actinomycetota bacterium]
MNSTPSDPGLPEVPENPDVPDEALARLRAADPAAQAATDLTALRAAVSRRADVPAADHPGDELATVRVARARSRSRWLQVAAGVAALAVVGTGAYAAGRAGDSGGNEVAAAISLGDSASSRSPMMSAADSAAGESAKMMSSWYGGGRTVFTASGLSDEGGTATAWAFDPAGVYSAQTATRLATALGVTGEPVQQWGAWTVGPQDGSGPTVSVQSDGQATFSYYDPTRDPWSCSASAADSPDSSGAEGGSAPAEPAPDPAATAVEPAPAPTQEPGVGVATVSPEMLDPRLGVVVPDCSQRQTPAPTGDAATGAARDTMSALGVDPSGYRFEVVTDTGSAAVVSVTASQVLDDQLTGVAWNFSLVADGVQSVYGALAPLVELGSYAVVSPAQAVARLTDPRFGAGFGGVMPYAVAEGAVADTGAMVAPAPSDDPTVPTAPAAGSDFRWPVSEVTITSARLGVALSTQADGAAVLIPSYELTGADGSTWSVIAVADDALDFSPVG